MKFQLINETKPDKCPKYISRLRTQVISIFIALVCDKSSVRVMLELGIRSLEWVGVFSISSTTLKQFIGCTDKCKTNAPFSVNGPILIGYTVVLKLFSIRSVTTVLEMSLIHRELSKWVANT